jgi:hypothetical protein
MSSQEFLTFVGISERFRRCIAVVSHMQPAITGKRSDIYNLVDKAHGGKPHENILAARPNRSGV